jgi:hypothetical protein
MKTIPQNDGNVSFETLELHATTTTMYTVCAFKILLESFENNIDYVI